MANEDISERKIGRSPVAMLETIVAGRFTDFLPENTDPALVMEVEGHSVTVLVSLVNGTLFDSQRYTANLVEGGQMALREASSDYHQAILDASTVEDRVKLRNLLAARIMQASNFSDAVRFIHRGDVNLMRSAIRGASGIDGSSDLAASVAGESYGRAATMLRVEPRTFFGFLSEQIGPITYALSTVARDLKLELVLYPNRAI